MDFGGTFVQGNEMSSRDGFTLIELMIVVVIIGVLAALAIPRFSAATDNAKEREADSILKQIYVYQTAYQIEHGTYADTHAKLETKGWGSPTAMQYYVVPANPSIPLCLVPIAGTGSHQRRGINVDGGIGVC